MTPSLTWRSTPRAASSSGRLPLKRLAGVLTETPRGLLLAVRVVPGAKKSVIAGEEHGRLKVRLQAPPVEGKANRALLEVLAAALGLKKNRLRIIAGEKARDKTVLLDGISEAEATALLAGGD